jgi:anaerobic magnesium-protoporphyrin IX monomethyl ester cyclase
MKIILVNPPPLQLAERHDMPDHPHSGLGYIASYLLSKKEKVKIIDAKLERLTISETVKKILTEKPEIVGITSMTHDIVSAANLASSIKKENPKIIIVIGGIHATALPKETLEKFKSFDFLVYGEGEYTFYNLLEGIKKKDVSQIKGVAYKKRGEVIVNPPMEKIEDLDSLPMPAWHLFPKTEKYHIVTARGCPYSCVFCMTPYGKKIRERSPENVIKEMKETIEKYNPRLYKFDDESFGFNKERAHEILDLIIKNKLDKVKKVASLRVNYVDFKLLKHMKKAGFMVIDFGFETGNPKIMKIIKKAITLEQIKKAVKMCKKVKIKVGGNFIIGHPYETRKTIKDTIKFAVKLNPDIVAFGIMVPYPGTEVAEMAKKGKGGYKIISSNWEDYNKQLGNALELKKISRKQLELYQLKAYISVYLLNFRIFDFIKFVWENRRAAFAFAKHFISRK